MCTFASNKYIQNYCLWEPTSTWWLMILYNIWVYALDHNDGQFFRAMEWLTIGTNGFLMVFKILRAMVNNGFEVNDGLETSVQYISMQNVG